MIYTELTKKAMKLCFDNHKEQKDKTGLPYVFHPFYLATQMKDEYSTVCALLHDIVEDCDVSFEDLEKYGFPIEVIEALKLLTHKKEDDYFDYVRKICTNELAVKVKIADLKHNSDLSRLDVIDEYALKRNEKYKKALELIKELTDIEV